MNIDPNGSSWKSQWKLFKETMKLVGKNIKSFFVDDVYGGVIKPAWDWISGTAAPAVGNFFTKTLPDWWNNFALNGFKHLFSGNYEGTLIGLAIDWWNDIKLDIGIWIDINIIQPIKNGLNKGLDWFKNHWRTIFDAFSGLSGFGGGIVSVLAGIGIISIPVVGQIILGAVSIGFGIYSVGRAFNWW